MQITDAVSPYPFLAQRRSVRAYRPDPVPREVLARIANAVTLAPAAHHQVHWHVSVITRADLRRRLAEAMAEAWDLDLAAAGVPAERRAQLTARSIRRLSHGPAQILLSVNTAGLPPGDSKQARGEDSLAVQSVAAATFAILLAAAAEGVGAAWHCPPLYCPEVVRAVLDLPAGLRPQALVTLGYPAQDPGPRPPRELGSALRWYE